MRRSSVLLSIMLLFITCYARSTFDEFNTLAYWIPDFRGIVHPMGIITAATLNATGKKYAWVGPVVFQDHSASKTLTRIGFRTAAVTKAGGSGMEISLQGVSGLGPPAQPDGVAVSTVEVTNAELTANAWIRTDPMGSPQTLNYGQNISVVIEFDASGRLGADSVIVAHLSAFSGSNQPLYGIAVSSLSVAAAWTNVVGQHDILLEFSDGTSGTIGQGFPISNAVNHSFNSGSGQNEFALSFCPRTSIKIDGLIASIQLPANQTETLTLYQGTTVLQSVTVSSTSARATSSTAILPVWIPETTLTAGTTYYLGVKTSGTTNTLITEYDFDTNTSNPFSFSNQMGMTSRNGSGAWSTIVSSAIIDAGFEVSAIQSPGTKGFSFSQ